MQKVTFIQLCYRSEHKNMFSYPTFEGFSRKIMTLTMILKNNEVLLGMKNRGIGEGKWNGFGGKVEPNETIDDAAKRYYYFFFIIS